MNLPIFFSEEIKINDGLLQLDEDTSRHCIQVLRMKNGERLQITNGKGMLLTTELTVENKKAASARVKKNEQFPSAAHPKIIAISLVKNTGRFEWFLEKATELGINHIIPLICERTEKQHFRLLRMKNILVSAMLQSRQVWLPVIREPVPFEQVLNLSEADQRFVAHCLETDKRLLTEVIKKEQSALLLIGPEGDFTGSEIEHATGNGFLPVSLGNTRLRTETAGVAAAVMMMI